MHGFVFLVLGVSGCGREAIVGSSDCNDRAPGDLVITEVHANPAGSDGEGEYIEIFNASGAPLELEGLTLTVSRSDGGGAKSHRFASALIGTGAYFVAGNAPVDSMPAHVDYSYGSGLGSLRNSDAVVSIACGDRLIDRMSYERTLDGRALELDGRFAPDHELNDEADHWCATPEGTGELSGGNVGTPGAANTRCEVIEVEGMCLEGGFGRAVRDPLEGELRITEWMADPLGVDGDFEWAEVLFEVSADLNGVQLGPAPDSLRATVAREECFPVDAGARVVFGASPAAAPRVDAELGFSLGNSGPRSIVVGVDGIVLDRVDYDGTVEGVSWQVDPAGNVCLTPLQHEYQSGSFGTPGGTNPACPRELGPGMCFENGIPRAIISPDPGDAFITEWMANPASVGNREGEWLEVRFDAEVDLNGLVLSDLTSSATTIQDERCLSVPAGAHVVFARNANPQENGGLDEVDATLTLSLNNSNETISLSVGGKLLDSVTYARSTVGVASQVDELGNVCDAVNAYGDGDLGTPGLANPRCS